MAPAATPRILVIRRRYIGDLVLLGSFLRNLRLEWPAARITVLVDEGYAEILALNPDQPEVWLIPRRARRWSRTLQLIRQLRQARFTHVFDFDNNDGTALFTRLTGAAFRGGFVPPKHAFRRGLAYTHLLKVAPEDYYREPITEYYLRLLQPAGIPIRSRSVTLTPRPDDAAAAAAVLGERNPARRPIVLLHPGSRSAYRLWPAERFARVADAAQRELGAAVILLGGANERPQLAAIRQHAREPLAAIDETLPLPRLAAVFAQAQVLLCHDSGPMHIAAAVGTRVVALFGSQSRTVWAPVGSGHQVLQAPLPCGAACVAPGECDPNNGYKSYCVRRISEAEVLGALRAALAG